MSDRTGRHQLKINEGAGPLLLKRGSGGHGIRLVRDYGLSDGIQPFRNPTLEIGLPCQFMLVFTLV